MEKPHTNLDFGTTFERAFLEAGFPVSGGVDLSRVTELYAEHASRYQDWISRGMHGEMKYLERGLDRRMDPRLVFPDTKSVLTVLLPYSPQAVGDSTLRYARYLNGPDYHETLKEKLEGAMQVLRSKAVFPENFSYKICVDTSAVLERTWAALTGLGWIGKNTLLIHPQLGSYTFIGVVFTNLTLNRGPKLLKDYCGECTRCIQACPTDALREHELDSRKCISYLTLEKRGEWNEKVNPSGFIAGCDLCQEVCPFNLKAVKLAGTQRIADYLLTDLGTLENESKAEYLKRIEGTALSRIKFEDFKRNLKNLSPKD